MNLREEEVERGEGEEMEGKEEGGESSFWRLFYDVYISTLPQV
jgi:hypothetical protein